MTPEEQAAREGRLCKHPLASLSDDVACVQCIAAALRQARQEEREACAKVAEAWADPSGLLTHHLSDLIPDYCCYEHTKIAAAIRARAQEREG